MVNPVRVPSNTTQTSPSTSRTPDSASDLGSLSSSDMQALRKTSQEKNDQGGGRQTPNSKADRSQNANAATSKRGGDTRQKNANRFGGLPNGLSQTNRNLSRPPLEFDVEAVGPGTKVLSTRNGDLLYNLRGPLADAIAERLASKMPKSEQPTLWLGENHGRISIAAIRAHLDEMVSPDEGSAIAVRSDGTMELRSENDYRNGDTLIIGRSSADPERTPA